MTVTAPLILNHEAAAIRDIPRTCACTWAYHAHPPRYLRVAAAAGCPWHSRHPRKEAA